MTKWHNCLKPQQIQDQHGWYEDEKRNQFRIVKGLLYIVPSGITIRGFLQHTVTIY